MDLATTYHGIELRNPIVHSGSPITGSLDNLRRLEDAGTSAVVMYSLFEEQVTAESLQLDHCLNCGRESQAEAMSYFPRADTYKVGPVEYLEHIAAAKRSLEIPVFGSLNGVSKEGWEKYARLIEEAGADALELNIYNIATDPSLEGREVEQMYVDVVQNVSESVGIPVAVKIGPFFSSMANMARRLQEAGASALVLFNRFYRPDIDVEKLEVTPTLHLSEPQEMLLPLRWVAILHGRVDIDFAISTGVHDHESVLKGLMAGASVVMMTSALLRHGIERVADVLSELRKWMEEHEYVSVRQMQGSMSQKNVDDPAAFERVYYVKIVHSWRPDPTGQLRF
jgi:dihydroorotate dehydrogenase (fumarate)